MPQRNYKIDISIEALGQACAEYVRLSEVEIGRRREENSGSLHGLDIRKLVDDTNDAVDVRAASDRVEAIRGARTAIGTRLWAAVWNSGDRGELPAEVALCLAEWSSRDDAPRWW